jgi:hypothetical protein
VFVLRGNRTKYTIRGLTLTGGDSPFLGGAIYAAEGVKEVVIEDSIITGNSSTNDGGGIQSESDLLRIRDSTISGNTSNASGGGVNATYGLVIIDSTISGNNARLRGGGVFADLDEERTVILDSELSGNFAESRGGGLYISHSNREGNVHVGTTLIENNHAYFGGGIAGFGSFTITGSTIRNNSAYPLDGTWLAGDGGGVLVTGGTPSITNSALYYNSAGGNGGAVYIDAQNRDAGLTLSNSTVSSNQAFGLASAIGVSPETNVLDRGIRLEHATIVENRQADSAIVLPFHTLHLDHTIVANSVFLPDFLNLGDPEETVSAMHSFLSDESTKLPATPLGQPDANGNYVGTDDAPLDPLLSELTDNGGPTWTHLPTATSLVLDAGNPDKLFEMQESDQRAIPYRRFVGESIDIGAVEAQSLPGDFNGDEHLDCDDVDLLSENLWIFDPLSPFDLNGDSFVDSSDVNAWLIFAGSRNLPSGSPYTRGDANLDGVVDTSDLNIVAINWRTDAPQWCSGNFNGDQYIDGVDLNTLGRNWRMDVRGDIAAAAQAPARTPRAPLAARIKPPIPMSGSLHFSANRPVASAHSRQPRFDTDRFPISANDAWLSRYRPTSISAVRTLAVSESPNDSMLVPFHSLIDEVMSSWLTN